MSTAHASAHPGALRELVRTRPILSFYLLSLVMVLAIIPVALATGWMDRIGPALERTGLDFATSYVFVVRLVLAAPETLPGVLLAVLQPLTPDIAAFIIMALGFGSVGTWALVRRYRPWRRGLGARAGLVAWGQMVAVMVTISLATAALNALWLPQGGWSWSLAPVGPGLLGALLIAMFLDAGGVAEETGWRGFALPILQARYGAFMGTLILGPLWAVWHLPVKLDLAFGFGWPAYAGMMVLFTVRLTLLSFVMTYFYNRVGGSTLMGIAMHGLHNDSAGLQGRIAEASYDTHWALIELALIVPIGIVAVALLVATRGRLAQADTARDPSPMPARALA